MTLRALGTVLRAAARRPRGPEVLAIGGALFGLGFAALSLGRPWVVNASIVLGVLVTLVAQHLVHGVARQNHPHLARLMPRHPQALRQAVGAIVSAGLLVTAALTWLLVPQERPAMLLVAPLVMWLSGCLALARTGLALLAPALAVGTLWGARQLGFDKTEALWAGIAVAAALAQFVLPRLLRRGDAQHATQWRRRRNTEALLAVSLEGGKLGAWQGQGWLARLMRWWLWPTRRMLDAARAPVRDARDALRRSHWSVSPSLHLAQQTWLLLTVGVPLFALAVAPTALRSEPSAWTLPLLQGLSVGLAMWLFLLNIGATLTEHWSTRAEQALLRLLPGLPQGEALGRAWRAQLRRHAIGGWFLHAVPAVAASLAWGPGLWPHALAGCLVAAPAALLVPLTRWQHQGAPRGTWMNWVSAWAAVCGAVAALPAAGGPPLGTVAIAAGLLGACLAWRWRPLPRSAPWPTGHAGLVDAVDPLAKDA